MATQATDRPGVEGYSWKPEGPGGLLTITRLNGNKVTILGEQ